MKTGLRELLAKAERLLPQEGDETIYELTDFDIVEVSTVDAPANGEEWLALKGLNNMGSKQLQEILGNGVGEFISKLEGQGEGDSLNADKPAALKLSETTKAATLQNLGAVIKALITIAKAVDGAEVAADAGDGLPSELQEVLQGAHRVLGETAGVTQAANTDEGEGEGEETDPAAAKRNTATKADEFQAQLDSLGSIIENIGAAVGVKPAGAGKDDDSKVADAEKQLADLAKAVGVIKTRVDAIGSHVGLPASKRPESPVTKKASDDDFVWPMNMNDKQFRKQHAGQ